MGGNKVLVKIIIYHRMFQEQVPISIKDIPEELVNNERNRQTLDNQKIKQEIKLQHELKLNQTCQSKNKKILLKYFLAILPQIQEKLSSNPLFSKWFEIEEDENKMTSAKFYSNMLGLLKKKSINSDQPLTFYNDYVGLNREIQSCFKPRKNFLKEEKSSQNIYEEIWVNKITCEICGKTLKNKAGLGSHRNSKDCKQAAKAQKSDEDEQESQEEHKETPTRRTLRPKTKQIQKKK